MEANNKPTFYLEITNADIHDQGYSFDSVPLELVSDPSIFPLSGPVPNRGLCIWLETQPNWYENANFKDFALCAGVFRQTQSVSVIGNSSSNDVKLEVRHV